MKYLYDASGNMTKQTGGNILSPQINGQPVKRVVAQGQFTTFSVLVEDTSGATFQWQFNGTDIPGATGDSLLLTNVTTINEGQYSVGVTNSAGSVVSAPAELMLDSDGEGLPDSWETANFTDPDPTHPLNPANQRSETDPDKDGVSNLDEFLDGTDPNNKSSLRPRLNIYSDAGGSVTVTPMKLSYNLGETVTLTPLPFPPDVFIGWAGDLNGTGTANPATLTMDKNKTVRARFAPAVPLPLPLPPGLIALWRGETDASDSVGGQHGSFFAGAVAKAPSITVSGKVGGAFDFDGTVHVRVPDSTALRPAKLTVEAWVFPTAPFGTVIARGSSTTIFNTWYLGLSSSLPTFISHGNHWLQGPSAIPLNEWTHLAITLDGFIKRLYVNGAQVAWIDFSKLGAKIDINKFRTLVYEATPVPVTIGSNWQSNASSNGFKGRIDELALYNRALTAEEILSIYIADFVGKNFASPYFTSPAQLPDAVLGVNYTQQLMTIMGTPPVNISLSEGLLPSGVAVSSDGLISGVPGTPGTFDLTMRVTDAVGAFTEQLCVLQVFASVPIPPGLIALWRGETDASDSVGGQHGSFFAGAVATEPSVTASGKVGGAINFDGTVHVRVPASAALKPEKLTVEAWVFPTAPSGTIIARGSSTKGFDTWNLGLSISKPVFISHDNDVLQSSSPVPLNEWTHLAITLDGLDKRLYVNGVQVISRSNTSALLYDAAPVPITIGADWAFNAPAELFTGRVDEVALYDRALSPAEIASIFNAGPAGKHL